MIDFNFISPTKIYFGKDKEFLTGEILKNYGFKNIMIVIGQGSVKKSGLLDKVINTLVDIDYIILSGVRPNPRIELVREGVKLAKERKIDCVLAIGGGSTIDTAKSIAVSYFYDGDPYDFNCYKAVPKKALPIGVILTISAAGSELSDSCVIADDSNVRKQGFNNDIVRPLFAIMNPELTISVNKYQTGCGVVDIISHSLERYFSPSHEHEFADNIALAIIKNMLEIGKIVINEPANVDARAKMMITSSYAHNGISELGKKKYMPIHKMEHALSAYDVKIAHGAGLSVLIPAWMEYVYKEDVAKFARFARVLFNVSLDDEAKSAIIGIRSLKKYFKDIGMPITLEELGLKKEDTPNLANLMTENGTRLIGQGSIKSLNYEDVINILNLTLQRR